MLSLTGFRAGSFVFGAVLLSSAGCAGADDPEEVRPARAELKCHASVIESDLETPPLEGSAVDPETGELQLKAGETYIVSSTYGIPKPSPDGMPLPPYYRELMGRIVQQLQTQPGLLALQLSTSESCGSGRTLAVWESEELMYGFVTSAPHLEAMNSAPELLQPGYAVTHWSATAPEHMTLTAAAVHLEEALAD